MKHFCLFDQTFLWLAAALTSCSELLSQEGRLGASVLQLPALRAGWLKVNHQILLVRVIVISYLPWQQQQAEDQKKVRSIRRRAVPGMAGAYGMHRMVTYSVTSCNMCMKLTVLQLFPQHPRCGHLGLLRCVCDACRLSHAVTLEHLPISLECNRRLFYMNVIDFL